MSASNPISNTVEEIIPDKRDKFSFADYLALPEDTFRQPLRVINLCKSDRYLSRGYYCSLLAEARGHRVTLLGMTTLGDQILDRSLSKVGGKGLFVKELEVALDEGRADIAVHSLKDVPMDLPPGFTLACVMEREDHRDALVCPHFEGLQALPPDVELFCGKDLPCKENPTEAS